MSTSPTSGAFRMVLGSSPSIAATMCLVTAFFDPRTEMSPRSGPDGSTCHVSVTQTTVGARVNFAGQAAVLPGGAMMPPRLDGHVDGSGECAGIRVQLGIYVVGAITPPDRATVVRHLAACPNCRDELAGLAALPGLLLRPPAMLVALSIDDPGEGSEGY